MPHSTGTFVALAKPTNSMREIWSVWPHCVRHLYIQSHFDRGPGGLGSNLGWETLFPSL